MSSHHVVREKQEPALIIHDLVRFNEEVLGQLLEWTPTIITNDQCARMLIEQGIKIDVLISHTAAWQEQSHVHLIQDEQKSFLDLSLAYLLSKRYPAVNIIGECISLDALTPYWEQINMVVLQQRKKIFSVKSGFRKWKPANDFLQIYGEEDTIQIKGLKRLDKHLYTTAADGFYELSFTDRPYILIAELL